MVVYGLASAVGGAVVIIPRNFHRPSLIDLWNKLKLLGVNDGSWCNIGKSE